MQNIFHKCLHSPQQTNATVYRKMQETGFIRPGGLFSQNSAGHNLMTAQKKNYTNTNFELVSSTTLVPSKSEHGCLTESRGCLSDQVRKKKRLAEFEHNARTFSSYWKIMKDFSSDQEITDKAFICIMFCRKLFVNNLKCGFT